jgi:alpha-L-fucosidase
VLGWPTEPILVQSLGTSSSTQPGKVVRVELLGSGTKVNWKQQPDGLRVELPKQYQPHVDYAAALKVTMA